MWDIRHITPNVSKNKIHITAHIKSKVNVISFFTKCLAMFSSPSVYKICDIYDYIFSIVKPVITLDEWIKSAVSNPRKIFSF